MSNLVPRKQHQIAMLFMLLGGGICVNPWEGGYLYEPLGGVAFDQVLFSRLKTRSPLPCYTETEPSRVTSRGPTCSGIID